MGSRLSRLMKVSFYCIIPAIIIIATEDVQAQLRELSLDERVENAEWILEGRVTERYSFRNATGSMIYTTNLVQVTKVFKGAFKGTAVDVITEGGDAGDIVIHFSETLELQPGDAGLFFCEAARVASPRKIDSELHVQPYGSLQGFVRYDRGGSAGSPFLSWDRFDPDLYDAIMERTGQEYREISPLNLFGAAGGRLKGNRVQAKPTIASFTPSSRSAGSDSALTITGNNFNTTRDTGMVQFRNADDGGASWIAPAASQYISWSNASIQTYVPTKAGSGAVRVINSDPDTGVSAATLAVPYALLNVTAGGRQRPTRFIELNPNGGLTWNMHDDFDGFTSAKNAFLRAFKNWRCGTGHLGGINWDLGPVTDVDSVGLDGISIIRFDNGSELPAGVLGRCTSYYSVVACSSDTAACVTELDIVFDDGVNWYYGTGTPGGSQYDFESVALHELGHGHQLAHVINSSAVMHYSIANGATKRALSANDTAAADNVLRRSINVPVCSLGGMKPIKAYAGENTAICSGNPVTLRAYGGITYAWNTGPGDTLPTKTVSPGSTTSYIVSVTNGTCMTQSDTVTITVNTPPAATAGADKSICAGDSIVIGAASADSLTTIGSSTSSTASFPFRTNAEDQRAQMMYDADELFAAGLRKGYITAIAFQISSVSSTKPMSGFQMSLKNTSDTSLSSGFRSQMTPVLSMASYTPKPGWDTLYLDSAFLWDGRSNLVVETCFDNTGTPSSSGYGVHVEVLTGFRATYNYGNGGCSAAASFISYNRPVAKIIWQAKQYRWSPGAGLNRAIVSNPKASPAAGTTYTLVVTDSNGCMDADDALVTVHPTNPTTLTWTGAVNTSWGVIGNWDSPCATPTAGDTVIIPAAATAPADVPASSLGGLTLGNTAGTSLAGDVGISGVLTLTSGKLALGTYNLSIGPAGSISGGSAASFIVTNGSGELRQADIGSGGRGGDILFPIGDSAARYSPVTISNTGTADEFRVRISGAVLTGGTSGTPYSSNMVGKTWHISEASAGGSSATLQFQWDRIVELPAFTRSNSAVARHNGSAWSTITPYGPASGANPYTRSAGGVSGFGAFAVGDIASPLPMELHTFTGKRAGASVELRWTTLSEINSLRYAVERRTPEDADWREIGAVPASGGSDVGIEYMFTDNAPPAGKRALYRLKMVDRDGSFAYSSILDIGSEIPTEIALDAVHPNPFTDATAVSFTLPSEEYVNLAVYDATGRRVRTLTAGMLPAGSHTRNFSAEDLPGGVYHIILSAGDAWRARSVVLAR